MKFNVMTAIAASLLLWQCGPTAEPLHHTEPQVRFLTEAESLTVSVGEPLSLKAEPVSGDGLTVGWYVDGVLECSSDEFVFTFEEPGVHIVTYKASNGAGSVEKEYTVTVNDVLEMHLSVGDSTEVRRVEQSTMKFYAIVDRGTDVEHSWSVDGVKMCDKAFFGTYFIEGTADRTVLYEGRNSAGSFRKSFVVKVSERPLEIRFSITSPTLAYTKGDVLKISAEIVYGGTGAVHKWTLGSKEVSDKAELSYVLTEPGTFELKYECVNGKGEKVEQSWTVNVSDRPEIVFADFEDGLKVMFKEGGGGSVLSIVDNPHKSDLNQSSKVLKAVAPVSKSTSGYFTILRSEIEKKGIKLSEYKGIRVKFLWLGKTQLWPRMDIGDKKLPKSEILFNGDWETLEYDIDFSTLKKDPQPRPFLTKDGKNVNTSVMSTREMYFDDFMLYK